MGRKKVEKAHWTPDTTLRPLMGHRDPMDKHIRRESVALTLSDSDMRRVQHEAAQVRVTLGDMKGQIATLKNEMRPHADREALLLGALVSGTLEEYRDVYEYADDAAGTVLQYDPETKQLLATRPMESWERQDEMDFDGDQGSEHDAEDEGNA